MTRLKQLRIEKGYSQLQIQKLTGINRKTYSLIERGIRTFSVEQCKRLAIALNTNMDYLTGLNDIKEVYPR